MGDFVHAQVDLQLDMRGRQGSKGGAISKLWKTVGGRLLAAQKKLFTEHRIDDGTAECRPVVTR